MDAIIPQTPQTHHAAGGDPRRQLADVAALALEEAQHQGASQCEADASVSQGLSVNVRLGEVDTVEYQRDRGLGVTVYFGKRKGAASTADLSAAAVRETVAKACAIARYTAEDPYSGLVEPESLARDIPDLDLDHPWELTPERAIELARECEAAGLAVDARVSNSEGASVNSQRHTGVYANSLGFLGGYSSTSHSVSCSLVAQQDDDMQRDYWYSIARDAAELEAAARVGRIAGERSLARLGARRLATRKAPVAFTPDAGARPVPAFHRCHQRHQPVPQVLVPAECRRRAGVPVLSRHAGAAAHPQGARQRALRPGGRRDPGPHPGYAPACSAGTCSAAIPRDGSG